jgi:hypothetical protein
MDCAVLMKNFVLLSAALVATSQASSQATDLDAMDVSAAEKFAMFKTIFNKSYTQIAEQAAFEAFVTNEQIIVDHNRQRLSYWLGHNTFSDLTWKEFASSHLGYAGSNANRPKNYDFSLLNKTVNDTSWDWTTKGAVTPVQSIEI